MKTLSVLGVLVWGLMATSALAGEYRYDSAGRLIWERHDDGKVTTYTYDAAGNRTAVTTTPTTPALPPSAIDDARVWNEGSPPLTIAVLSNDVANGGTLSLATISPPTFGTASISGNSVVYTAPANGNRLAVTDSFTYVALGAGGLSDSAVVTVDLTNLPPVANPNAFTVPRNFPSTLSPLLNDTDPGGDTLSISSITAPAHGQATNLGTSIRYQPTQDYAGPDGLNYTVSDGEGGQATAAITITVTSVNNPPVAVNDDGGAYWNQTVEIEVLLNDSDPDGDTFRVLSTTQGTHGSTGPTLDFKRVAYTASSGFVGQDFFTYTIRDSQGATATATVQVSVDSGN